MTTPETGSDITQAGSGSGETEPIEDCENFDIPYVQPTNRTIARLRSYPVGYVEALKRRIAELETALKLALRNPMPGEFYTASVTAEVVGLRARNAELERVNGELRAKLDAAPKRVYDLLKRFKGDLFRRFVDAERKGRIFFIGGWAFDVKPYCEGSVARNLPIGFEQEDEPVPSVERIRRLLDKKTKDVNLAAQETTNDTAQTGTATA